MRDKAVAGNGVRGFGLRGVILSGVATVAASLGLSLPATAAAEERVCRGTIGDRSEAGTSSRATRKISVPGSRRHGAQAHVTVSPPSTASV